MMKNLVGLFITGLCMGVFPTSAFYVHIDSDHEISRHVNSAEGRLIRKGGHENERASLGDVARQLTARKNSDKQRSSSRTKRNKSRRHATNKRNPGAYPSKSTRSRKSASKDRKSGTEPMKLDKTTKHAVKVQPRRKTGRHTAAIASEEKADDLSTANPMIQQMPIIPTKKSTRSSERRAPATRWKQVAESVKKVNTDVEPTAEVEVKPTKAKSKKRKRNSERRKRTRRPNDGSETSMNKGQSVSSDDASSTDTVPISSPGTNMPVAQSEGLIPVAKKRVKAQKKEIIEEQPVEDAIERKKSTKAEKRSHVMQAAAEEVPIEEPEEKSAKKRVNKKLKRAVADSDSEKENAETKGGDIDIDAIDDRSTKRPKAQPIKTVSETKIGNRKHNSGKKVAQSKNSVASSSPFNANPSTELFDFDDYAMQNDDEEVKPVEKTSLEETPEITASENAEVKESKEDEDTSENVVEEEGDDGESSAKQDVASEERILGSGDSPVNDDNSDISKGEEDSTETGDSDAIPDSSPPLGSLDDLMPEKSTDVVPHDVASVSTNDTISDASGDTARDDSMSDEEEDNVEGQEKRDNELVNAGENRNKHDTLVEDLFESDDEYIESEEEEDDEGEDVDKYDSPLGLEYLGAGYDIIQGNPLGDTITLLDPGFRANIIQMHWSKDSEGVSSSMKYIQPKGGWIRSYISCHKGDSVSEVGTEDSIKNALSVDASVSAELPGDVARFSASVAYNSLKKSESQSGRKSYVSKSYCFNYVAGIPTSVKWDLTFAFEEALKSLPSIFQTETENATCSPNDYRLDPFKQACVELGVQKWMKFFTIFGTHVTTKVYLGGKLVTLMEISAKQEEKLTSLGVDVQAALVAQVKDNTIESSVGATYDRIDGSSNKAFGSNNSTFMLGGDIYGNGEGESFNLWAASVSEFSMPIKSEYTPISMFINPKYKDAYNSAYLFYGKMLVGSDT